MTKRRKLCNVRDKQWRHYLRKIDQLSTSQEALTPRGWFRRTRWDESPW